MNTRQIKVAEKIINDYCQVIELADASLYGLPESLLQYSKAQIKQAIFTALAELHADEVDLRETLVQSLLYLAQFIPDEQVDIIHRGQDAILSGDINHPDLPHGEEAIKIINGIKTEMEELKSEANAYILKKYREQQHERQHQTPAD